MFQRTSFFVLFFIFFSQVYSQSPYGRILTLDNNGAQRWILLEDVLNTFNTSGRSPSWLTNGNNLSSGQFLGTTNDMPLIFRTNNTERVRITESGYFGIGVANPLQMLDVNGNVRFSGALMPNGNAGTSGQILVSQGADNPPIWVTFSFVESDPIFQANIDATGATTGNLLRHNGTKFVPVAAGDLTTTTTGVTITGGNGVLIGSGTTIDIATASATQTGLLSSSDWTTFNNKENVLTFNSPLSRDGNAISIPQANGTTDGYLSSSDWNTFNSKENALTKGNLTTSTPGVTITGGTNAVIGSGTTIDIATASATQTGLLSSSDWTSFNNRWSLSGNTLSGTERLGSTNNQPVVMIINNTDRFRFTSKGQIEVLCSSNSVFVGEGAGTNQSNFPGVSNVFVGYQSGYFTTTGGANVASGYQALYSNTTGYQNTACGSQSLYYNTTGIRNTAIGSGALNFNTTGSYNTAIGYLAGTYDGSGGSNSSANNSVFIGYDARPRLYGETNQIVIGAEAVGEGSNSVVIGNNNIIKTILKGNVGIGTTSPEAKLHIYGRIYQSGLGNSTYLGYEAGLYDDLSNNSNTGIGSYALRANTSGEANTACGSKALVSNTTGSWSVAVGYETLQNNTTGSQNTAVGAWAHRWGSSGSGNTTVGYSSLHSNNGNYNTAIGVQSLSGNSTGCRNVAVGYQSLYTQSYNSGGTLWNSDNVAVGYQALYSNQPTSTSNGIQNTAIGNFALYSNSTGLQNTASGYYSLYSNSTGNCNTANGVDALRGNFNGSYNTATGCYSLRSNISGSNNTGIGTWALGGNTDGNYNTASGVEALRNNSSGSRNIAVGYQSLYSQSYSNLGNTWNSDNVAVGYQALYSNQPSSTSNGIQNTAIGNFALYSNNTGYSNTACGVSALYSNTTGSENTALGYNAGSNLTTGSNNILIGYNAQPSSATVSNEVTIGNSNNNVYRMYAASWTNASDARYKHDIEDLPYGLEFVKKLRPRQFVYNNSDDGRMTMGFIAQEVQAAMEELNMRNYNLVRIMEKDYLGLNTTEMIPVLVRAIQEQQQEINRLQQENEELRKANERYTSEIEKLRAEVENIKKYIPQVEAFGSSK